MGRKFLLSQKSMPWESPFTPERKFVHPPCPMRARLPGEVQVQPIQIVAQPGSGWGPGRGQVAQSSGLSCWRDTRSLLAEPRDLELGPVWGVGCVSAPGCTGLAAGSGPWVLGCGGSGLSHAAPRVGQEGRQGGARWSRTKVNTRVAS